jgi:predicted AlkP superfamily pyrophosphatase or phosphodiesterase
MIANGFFHRALRKPLFWEQSAGLVEGHRIWERFRSRGKRVAMLFWQQSLGEEVDLLLSPAPIHKHHGGMIQGCYSKPPDLYERLCNRIGRPFKLQHYWGPLASWKVGEWIARAVSIVAREYSPDLILAYLPTMDYELQRKDPDTTSPSLLKRLERQLAHLVGMARDQYYDVLVFGDYRIAPVTGPIFPNVALREANLMEERLIRNMSYPDFYGSRAFAVVDHEIAHVYVPEEGDLPLVRNTLETLPGISQILGRREQEQLGLNHPNSGELVVVAEEGKWFAYPWWAKKSAAPEFARHVDIHNKPGYDPCELFFGWPPGSVSLKPERIKGSHGRVGPGREVSWASTFRPAHEPADLIELAAAVRSCLERTNL